MKLDAGGFAPTDLLFQENPHCGAVRARVLEARIHTASPERDASSGDTRGERLALVLDRTIFYPEGGGQPCDSGSISGWRVLSVTESKGIVTHVVERGDDGEFAIPAVGCEVELELDAARRRDFTQQHSAQHLLSATLLAMYGAPTVSMHLGTEKSTIDVDIPTLDASRLRAAEMEVNALIAKNLPITVHLCPPEDPDSFPLRKRPPAGEELIRIVEIAGIDYSPCCGTHAASTLELRMLAIAGAEKYKGMMRISFVAGARAIVWCSERSRILDDAAAGIGVTARDLPERLGLLASHLREREADVDSLLKLAAGQRAAVECSPAEIRKGVRVVFLEGNGVENGSSFALECSRGCATLGYMALVASLPDVTLCATAPEGRVPPPGFAKLLSGILKESGGRGGGSGDSFRASFVRREDLERFMESAENLLSRL